MQEFNFRTNACGMECTHLGMDAASLEALIVLLHDDEQGRAEILSNKSYPYVSIGP